MSSKRLSLEAQAQLDELGMNFKQYHKLIIVSKDKELKDGDITEKGWRKKRMSIIQNFDEADSNSSPQAGGNPRLSVGIQGNGKFRNHTNASQMLNSSLGHLSGSESGMEAESKAHRPRRLSKSKNPSITNFLSKLENPKNDMGYLSTIKAKKQSLGHMANLFRELNEKSQSKNLDFVPEVRILPENEKSYFIDEEEEALENKRAELAAEYRNQAINEEAKFGSNSRLIPSMLTLAYPGGSSSNVNDTLPHQKKLKSLGIDRAHSIGMSMDRLSISKNADVSSSSLNALNTAESDNFIAKPPVSPQKNTNNMKGLSRGGTFALKLDKILKTDRPRPLHRKASPVPEKTSHVPSEQNFQVSNPRAITLTAIDSQIQVDLSNFSSLAGILRQRSFLSPKSIAYMYLDEKGKEKGTITYEKLNGRAEKIAVLLEQREQLHDNSRVGLLYRKSEIIEMIVALMGCAYANVVAVPMVSNVNVDQIEEMSEIMTGSRVKIVLTTDINIKALNKQLINKSASWPEDIEWWKTNELGAYVPKKHQAPFEYVQASREAISYVEYTRSPVGQLKGMQITNDMVLSQLFLFKTMNRIIASDLILSNLESRQSLGLLVGPLLNIFCGTTTIFIPNHATEKYNLWTSLIKKYEITVALIDQAGARDVLRQYKNLSAEVFKKLQSSETGHSLQSLKLVAVDFAPPYVRVDAHLMEDLHEIFSKLKMSSSCHLTPVFSMPEIGAMIVSMYSVEDACDPKEITINLNELCHNRIKEEFVTIPTKDTLRLVDVGVIFPSIKVAIVDPASGELLTENSVGEIWVQFQHPLGRIEPEYEEHSAFFLEARLQQFIDGELVEIENEGFYVRSGYFGFLNGNRIYTLGYVGERMELTNYQGDIMYFYTHDILRILSTRFDGIYASTVFSIYLNDQELAVLVIELDAQLTLEKSSKLSKLIAGTMLEEIGLNIFSIILCPKKTIPRSRDGSISLEHSRKKYDMGLLEPYYSYINLDCASKWALRPSDLSELDHDGLGKLANLMKKSRADLQISDGTRFGSVGHGYGAVDRETKKDLLEFESITGILIWRNSIHPKNTAYTVYDERGKEKKKLSYEKFEERVSRMVYFMEKSGIKHGNYVFVCYPLSLDYIVCVHACMYKGIIPICLPFPNADDLANFSEILVKLMEEYQPDYMLTNASGASILDSKGFHHSFKKELQKSVKVNKIPLLLETDNPPKQKTALDIVQHSDFLKIFDHGDPKGQLPIVLVDIKENRRYFVSHVSHDTIISQCTVLKEFCNLSSSLPIVCCDQPTYGFGFLYAALLGIYVGSNTIIYPEFESNPQFWMELLFRYNVRDSYITYSMMKQAMSNNNSSERKIFMLHNLKNIHVLSPERPNLSVGLRMVRKLASYDVSPDALALTYNPPAHPFVSSRSYMPMNPLQLFVNLKDLRRNKISVSDKQDYGYLRLTDSGRATPCTSIAIVSTASNEICVEGEVGEICVSSPANVDRLRVGPNLSEEPEMEATVIGKGKNFHGFARTGDLGFLYRSAVPFYKDGSTDVMDGNLLFVLGNKKDILVTETMEDGEKIHLVHYPIDLENTIELCHPGISSSVVFQTPNTKGLVVLAELFDISRDGWDCVNVIVNSVLDVHQISVGEIVFLKSNAIPKTIDGHKRRIDAKRMFENNEFLVPDVRKIIES